jgi:hypothetical protein
MEISVQSLEFQNTAELVDGGGYTSKDAYIRFSNAVRVNEIIRARNDKTSKTL